jgi:fructose-1-phosphate kinase PfkB-like protein
MLLKDRNAIAADVIHAGGAGVQVAALVALDRCSTMTGAVVNLTGGMVVD